MPQMAQQRPLWLNKVEGCRFYTLVADVNLPLPNHKSMTLIDSTCSIYLQETRGHVNLNNASLPTHLLHHRKPKSIT